MSNSLQFLKILFCLPGFITGLQPHGELSWVFSCLCFKLGLTLPGGAQRLVQLLVLMRELQRHTTTRKINILVRFFFLNCGAEEERAAHPFAASLQVDDLSQQRADLLLLSQRVLHLPGQLVRQVHHLLVDWGWDAHTHIHTHTIPSAPPSVQELHSTGWKEGRPLTQLFHADHHQLLLLLLVVARLSGQLAGLQTCRGQNLSVAKFSQFSFLSFFLSKVPQEAKFTLPVPSNNNLCL